MNKKKFFPVLWLLTIILAITFIIIFLLKFFKTNIDIDIFLFVSIAFSVSNVADIYSTYLCTSINKNNSEDYNVIIDEMLKNHRGMCVWIFLKLASTLIFLISFLIIGAFLSPNWLKLILLALMTAVTLTIFGASANNFLVFLIERRG